MTGEHHHWTRERDQMIIEARTRAKPLSWKELSIQMGVHRATLLARGKKLGVVETYAPSRYRLQKERAAAKAAQEAKPITERPRSGMGKEALAPGHPLAWSILMNARPLELD